MSIQVGQFFWSEIDENWPEIHKDLSKIYLDKSFWSKTDENWPEIHKDLSKIIFGQFFGLLEGMGNTSLVETFADSFRKKVFPYKKWSDWDLNTFIL